ncbi:threonine-phosphate decarboxylase CobD [Oscillatoria sp. FACHB-1406]|uniref:threonine-phosphate decarboxylase CobD n=1 Tax=Oscillatoria sp. FACHB-1406 TaxID=2692846 RepID=UPI001683F1B6|nr:threonine-phosphate decarboxylase CobD [Oscillatoria sp. FACHB-1406]MBD2577127.1 threonine-phosphate decarboxylase [Oscillatoria sp. FACHB-1406]
MKNRPIHGGNLAWAAALAGCPPTSILDFSASINPLGPPESAIAAIGRGLGAIAAYPDPHYSQLRSALAQHHDLDPAWVLPGNGSAELLTWAGRELAQLGIIETIAPTFRDYDRALETFGATVCKNALQIDNRALPLPSFAIAPHNEDASTHLPLFEGHRWPVGGAMYRWLHPPQRGLLLNNPHNPTGKIWSLETLLPLLTEFDLIVADEAFMDFLAPAEQASLVGWVKEFKNLVVLRSLTKFYSLPGLRLGYAIAHPDRLARWQKWRDPWPVNVLAEAAAIAALQDTAFAQKTMEWLPPAKAELIKGLQALEGLDPFEGAANFLFVRCDRSVSQLQMRLLKKHRILIRDCLSFPELGDRYFRIAVRTPEENQRLLEALRGL